MPKVLAHLGRFSARHRVLIIAAWVVVLAVFAAITATSMNLSGGTTSAPSTAASKALTSAEKKFPALSTSDGGKSLQLVLETRNGHDITDPTTVKDVTAILTRAHTLPHVTSVSNPLDPTTPAISKDHTTALATVTFSGITDSNAQNTYQKVLTFSHANSDHIRILVGGALATDSYEAGGAGEVAGIVVAFLVLFLTLGTLLAAGANMLNALIGVGAGVLGVLAWSSIHPLDGTVITLPGMLGLAVGIDYSLFILTRFKAELKRGRSVLDAVSRATATAGTAVVFAGLTVIIALVGLWITQISTIQDMGIAGAFAVFIAVMIALTLMPVLLRSMGTRVLNRKERAKLDAGILDEDVAPRKRSLLVGWSNAVARRPLPMLVGAAIVLAIIAVPFLSMKTVANIPGGSNPDSMQRHAYNLVVDKFSGIQSPLIVVADGATISSKLPEIEKTLSGYDHVEAVTPGQVDKTDDAALITVIPTGSPIDENTTKLVQNIRADATSITGVHLEVTGETAIGLDMTTLMNQALIKYVAVIVLLSFILMIIMFRSLLVPLFATLGYLLSLGAALGALTAVFQWGWLSGIVQAPGDPIMSLLPIILVGVLFGLAMDYQVFMTSRIREEYVAGLSPKEAIRSGFRKAGPVLVAAALIMTFVFAGFASSTMTFAAETAFGLMIGVLADAFLVRMIIVPSLISLLGKAAWWMPKWMQRIIPNVDTEGGDLDPAPHATDAMKELQPTG
jgi:RND superfamily putative drug exporter